MPLRRATVRQTGFTLIEVLVTIAIIGILAAVAMPQYTNYVTRGRIPDATSHLATLQTQMEQFYQDNHTYVNGPGCTSDSTTSKYYTFACSGTTTATTYTLTATGTNQMTGFTYTVDQAGNKTTTIASTWAGWTGSTTCWITKQGGVC